ncbi:hypothetical protein EK21DRAFT_116654 [Setomelanomma holmii]|uniref:Uncharacterized protein n=1 Tax=Setomelanomma holmii TaxID=210430 RepID=A0A9P4H1T4_9PLEO|nr:hypothetical protein EK21DRAFT_116654 [Setomelanomma holmii]
MALENAIQRALQNGFRHERPYPELPPGYDWETQKKKYSQGNLWTLLRTYRYANAYENILETPGAMKFGHVFCHRGLYDRALGYPEDSLLAVENGLRHGLYFHELDGNMGQRPYEGWQLFIAHDRVSESSHVEGRHVVYLQAQLTHGNSLICGPLTFTVPAEYLLITIMMFYSYPVVNEALRNRGIDPDKATAAQKVEKSYRELHELFRKQVQSFADTNFFQFIFEIVLSGFELGYNARTGHAVNPLDGSAIEDPEVLFESRVHCAMIDIALALRKIPSPHYFSSCTRLCDVRTLQGEMTASFQTGHMQCIPSGVKGLQTKTRTMHGGLYPQSDLVIADDPFAEIAARTWIDEYAKLDRL